jgi:RNase H-like domain found in reverse transcriptase/Reverse transcriptase (RNA-dependent DNA polymerase)/Integrase zinc binding domain/Integrase core domain
VPFKYRGKVRETLQIMQKWGIIERGQSEYLNPLVVVIKSNGEVRLCIDGRKMNEILVPDRERTLPPDEIMQHFFGSTWLSSTDMSNSFWQIKLAKDSKKYTAFMFEGQTYVFNVVPFGLNISMPAFSRGMDYMLSTDYDTTIVSTNSKSDNLITRNNSDKLDDEIVTYVDDVLFKSKGRFIDHLLVLRKFFSKLSKSGMTIKLSKSKFFCKELPFLGHILTTNEIKICPKKRESIRNFPLPKTLQQLKAFLGLVNYMRKFLPHISTVEATLRELEKKENKGKNFQHEIANKKYIDAFNKIKTMIEFANPLCHIDPSLNFYVQTDASTTGLAGIVYQIDPSDNHKRLVGFCSKTLNAAEQRYTITELELFAIVYTLTRFRNILIGDRFIIMCDHKALIFLNSCYLVGGRLTRWKLFLQEFDFEIVFIKGIDNILADYLSRLNMSINCDSYDLSSPKELHIFKIYMEQRNLPDWKNIAALQAADSKLSKIMSLFDPKTSSNNMNEKTQKTKASHCMEDNILFRKTPGDENWKICVPECLIDKLVKHQHSHYGHFGPLKIAKVMKETFCFNNMRRRVHAAIIPCSLCQRTKPLNRNYTGEMQPILATRPRQIVACDIYGELPQGRGGTKFIFVLYDVFAKFVVLYAIKRSTTAILVHKIRDYVNTYGQIQSLLNDNAPQFKSAKWEKQLREMNINVKFVSKYHPAGNPSERVMRELGRLFRAYCSDQHTSWTNLVPTIQNGMNVTVNGSTNRTPWELMNGIKPIREIERIINFPDKIDKNINYEAVRVEASEFLTKKAAERKKQFDKRCGRHSFKVGDKVLYRVHKLSNKEKRVTHKFFHLYDGPYEIISIPSTNAFKIKNLQTNEIEGPVNATDMRPYLS